MTINDLKYFDAVCVYKSISAAADYLHISQPSLSIAIRGLEDEFGVTLFERRRHGVVLTPGGEALYKRNKDFLQGFVELENMMQDLGNKRKSIRIGVPPMISSLILPYICGKFTKEHPDIRLDVTESGAQELSQRLIEGRIDMVFLPHNSELATELSAVKVASLEVVCCAAQGSDLANRGPISPYDLKDRQLVLFGNSFFQAELIKKQFSEYGVEPRIILQTDQLSTVISMAESGVAAGFLFDELVRRQPRLVQIPLKDKISVDVSLAYKKGTYMSESMKAFRRFITERALPIGIK